MLRMQVNNAGVSNRGSCVDTPMRVQRQLMEVNYFGHIAITRALLNSIPDDGAIITISSIQGKVAMPYRSAYSVCSADWVNQQNVGLYNKLISGQ